MNTIERIPPGNSAAITAANLPDNVFETLVSSPPAISPDDTRMAIGVRNEHPLDDRGGLYLVDLQTGIVEDLIQLSGLPTGTYADLDEQSQADFWKLDPVAIAWLDTNSLLVKRADFISFDIPAAPYMVSDLVSNTAVPLIELSTFSNVDLFNWNEDLRIAHFAYYASSVLLSSDNLTLYYESQERFSDNQLLLALPIPPDGTNEPQLVILAELPDTIGMPRYEFIAHVSDGGRFGLYNGYYLIEFAVDGGA